MRFQSFIKPLIGISLFLGMGYLILYPVFTHAKTNAQRSSCQSNLKQIALACSQYLGDNDGRFPAISRGERGWADALKTQVGAETYAIFHCPTTRQQFETRSSDFFFNARISNLKSSQIPFPTSTISFGEGMARGGTNSHFSELPLDWKSDENSPARRHLSGANYAFADGHVKFLRFDKITVQKPSNYNNNWKPTFAVR